jgi:hypothetical protein
MFLTRSEYGESFTQLSRIIIDLVPLEIVVLTPFLPRVVYSKVTQSDACI